MIIGIGTDLCPIERMKQVLERHDARFITRCFSVEEQKQSGTLIEEQRSAFFTKRYAAKEACAKALGTGIRESIFLKDIVVQNDTLGKPSLVLKNGARKQLEKITPKGYQAHIHLSLSDDSGIAIAFVIIDAKKNNNEEINEQPL